MSSLESAILTFGLLAVLIAGWAWWSRRNRLENHEPLYELEKLVYCRSCGSLIPEGVRQCAFCGAWQRQHPSEE